MISTPIENPVFPVFLVFLVFHKQYQSVDRHCRCSTMFQKNPMISNGTHGTPGTPHKSVLQLMNCLFAIPPVEGRHVIAEGVPNHITRSVSAATRGSIGLGAAVTERAGRGSVAGRWEPRPGSCPNIRGGITIERDLAAGTKLWLIGWTKTIAGGEFVSLLVEIADKGGRPRRRRP
jgi:hypothetical protein